MMSFFLLVVLFLVCNVKINNKLLIIIIDHEKDAVLLVTEK